MVQDDLKRGFRVEAERLSPELISWRRHLHRHPELSWHEEKTSQFAASRLREMGYSPQERVGDTFGVVATIGPVGRPQLALRADMDALPIQEANTCDYRSVNDGVMHACGHDAHTAMLLGAAKILADHRNELRRPVKLIFQPAEEQPPGGANALIRAGVLENVERIFGLHIWSLLPAGLLGIRPGPFLASGDTIRIEVVGRGGHAAMPHDCIDPVLVGAHIVSQLQSILSRTVSMLDRVVLSITQFHAGVVQNVIPDTAMLGGTVRAFSEQSRKEVIQRVREIAEGVAQAHRARATLTVIEGFPTLVNDASAVDALRRAAQPAGFNPEQIIEMDPIGGSEDFAFYSQKIPSAFAFLGGGNAELDCTYPHHHSRFNIDETALPAGAALLASIACGGE